MLKHLPNFLTTSNLFLGCLGVVAAFNNDLILAAYFMWAGGLCDFFDGFAARLVKSNSEFGKQLDSLADVITFGLLPGVIVFHLLQNAVAIHRVDYEEFAYFAFLIPVFSALRLAKFNIDERQSEDFIGLNTPSNAIFFSSFIFLIQDDFLGSTSLIQNPWVLIAIVVIFCLLMVSELKIFGFKFKNFSFKENKIRFLFLLLAIILFVFFRFSAIPLIIILYLTLSLVQQYLIRKT